MEWDKFSETWGTRLDELKLLLKYLSFYPDIIEQNGLAGLTDSDELENHQKNWLHLVSILNKEDSSFIHPWYVPVSSENYDLYADLSDFRFSLIELVFIGDKNVWYINRRINGMFELIQFCNNSNLLRDIDPELKVRIDELLRKNFLFI